METSNFFKRTSTVLLSLLSAVLLCDVAVSQDRLTRQTVATRYRADFDPIGASLGGFQLLPEVGVLWMSDDNVFATRDNAADDTVVVLRPSIALESDWTRHRMAFGAEGEFNRFSEFSNEDHESSNFYFDGRLDTSNSGFLFGRVGHRTDFQGRESPEDVNGVQRTKFRVDNITLDYRVSPGRMFMEFGVDAFDLDYDDVQDPNGVIINNDDRDGRRQNYSVRVGYEIVDGYSLFVEGVDRSFDYDDPVDDFGSRRSSDGYEAVIGATMNSSDVLFGDIFVGKLSETYEDPGFPTNEGTSFGADLSWNLSGLTTLILQGRRDFLPTTITGASGINSTSYTLRADHELLRNLIVTLEWSGDDQAFEGIERQDEYQTIRLLTRYLLNRRLEIQFEYRDQERQSTADENFEYARRQFGIQLIGHL